MAYVDCLSMKKVDYSKPYKTFNDLSDNDQIFLIDFRNLEIKTLSIKKENNDYNNLNEFEVNFEIPGITRITIHDGNCYLDKVYFRYGIFEYITTDERIAKTIIDLLRSRNSHQFDCLMEIFGNPMSKYAEKEIRLG